jgi:hypothetical protein
MKKNYIKPVSKTVMAEMLVGTMQVVASKYGIDYGGEDDGTHTPEAPEREEEDFFAGQQEKNTYSLW